MTIAAFAPLLSVVLAATVAQQFGCTLDEGSVHPCLVAGQDIGDLLYAMGVMGWLMLLTAPVMLGVMVVWVWLLGRALLARRRQRLAGS